MAMPGIKWEDNPNRKERRRRWKAVNSNHRKADERGGFGASPLNTANAIKRREKRYHSS